MPDETPHGARKCPAIAPGCPQTHPTPSSAPSDVERVTYAYAPLKALVDSRGVTLHAAVAKARGMRAAMLARRNTRGVRTSTVRGAGTAHEPTPTGAHEPAHVPDDTTSTPATTNND